MVDLVRDEPIVLPRDEAPRRGWASGPYVVIGLAVLAGIVFRLMLPDLIEYHSDEQFTFDHVARVLAGGEWPARGMTMSIGGLNAGMSVWIFIILGFIAQVETPPDLAQAIQLLNVAAILGFIGFVVHSIPKRDREPWLWAAALWSVNPLAVIYERKIWPPCTLPIFFVVMLAGWWYRRYFLGSFIFAATFVLGAQIHPTAAFLGISILAWTVFSDRRSLNWAGIAAGGAVGFLPALGWAMDYWRLGNSLHVLRPPSPNFYAFWLSEPFGFGSEHTLGPVEFPRWLTWPILGGTPTYLVLFLHLIIGVASIALVGRAVWRMWNARGLTWRWMLVGETAAGVLVRAAFFGFGTILTVLSARGGGLYQHYLVVMAPLMMLWVGLVATFADGGVIQSRGRSLLTTLCVSNVLLVIFLFSYIDAKGAIRGEFGPSWRYQQMQQFVP